MKFANGIPDDMQSNLAMIDELGGTKTYNHYPNGWAMAFNTPFKMWKRYEFQRRHRRSLHHLLALGHSRTRPGGARLRHQLPSCDSTSCRPSWKTLGVQGPPTINGHVQSPFDGVSMRYSVDMASGPSARKTQFYSMLGSRGIWHDGWKARHHPSHP